MSQKFGTYQSLIRGNYIPNGYLLRKNIIDKIEKCTSDTPLEDWFLMLQFAKVSKIKFIDDILFSYRWHSCNSIKNVDKISNYLRRTFVSELKILKKDGYHEYEKIVWDFLCENCRIRFKIGKLLKLYKVKHEYLDRDIYIFEFLNKEIFRFYK